MTYGPQHQLQAKQSLKMSAIHNIDICGSLCLPFLKGPYIQCRPMYSNLFRWYGSLCTFHVDLVFCSVVAMSGDRIESEEVC